jgi:protein SCO1/2
MVFLRERFSVALRRTASIGAVLLWLAACAPAAQVYDVTGTVAGLDAQARQLVVAHDEIPGFMPAMTMNFDVAQEVALAALAAGDRIRFRLERTGSSLRIVSLQKTGEAGVAAGVAGGASVLPSAPDQAPDFELTDQDGRRFALRDLRGSAVLLDFIFTRCEGPCPILTSRQVELQRRLDEPLRSCLHFASISVDPAHDQPHVLREYARARGADLRGWSFLTGRPDAVARVLASYGIASSRTDQRTLQHTVAVLAIDRQGRIARRYLGLEQRVEQIESDLRKICS